MWSLLPAKIQLTVIFILGLLTVKVWDAAAALAGGENLTLLTGASLAATVVGTVFVILFNLTWRWLWRKLPILSRVLAPDLTGEWRGTLTSTWINPDTNQSPAPIDSVFTIEQTLLKVCVTMRTGESSSESGRAYLEKAGRSGCYRLWYDYRNTPKAQVEHRSASHDGVAYLDTDVGADRDRLEGRYYTARKTTGDILLQRSTA